MDDISNECMALHDRDMLGSAGAKPAAQMYSCTGVPHVGVCQPSELTDRHL